MVKYAYTYFTSTDAYMEYTVCLVFSVPFLNERHGKGGGEELASEFRNIVYPLFPLSGDMD